MDPINYTFTCGVGRNEVGDYCMTVTNRKPSGDIFMATIDMVGICTILRWIEAQLIEMNYTHTMLMAMQGKIPKQQWRGLRASPDYIIIHSVMRKIKKFLRDTFLKEFEEADDKQSYLGRVYDIDGIIPYTGKAKDYKVTVTPIN